MERKEKDGDVYNRRNVFSEEFDGVAALTSGFWFGEGDTDSKRFREVYNTSVALDNVSQCRILEEKPFYPLGRKSAVVAPVELGKRREREKVVRKSAVVCLAEKHGQTGPLSMLLDAMRSRTFVAVLVRRTHSLHRIWKGTVIAFDKHMNIVLGCVEESQVLSGGGVTEALVHHHSQKRHHANEVFLRGDTVVLVVKLIRLVR